MINLKQANILNLLPPSLTDTNEAKALAYSIQQAMASAVAKMEQSMVYADIDHLPDKILDVLAAELNVPFWRENFSIEEKRRVVKNAYSWLAKGGTPGAIKELVRSFFDLVDIEEWYDYNGSPYHFRVNIGIIGTPSADDQLLAANLINSFKNVRSVVDSINFYESGSEVDGYALTSDVGECIEDGGSAYNY